MANGEKAEGEWKNDEFVTGLYTNHTYKNGDKYTGAIANGKRNGQGNMTFANGNIYTGEWMNDMFNGEGTLTYTPGQTCIKSAGTFKDGILISGRIENSDGSVHEIIPETTAENNVME